MQEFVKGSYIMRSVHMWLIDISQCQHHYRCNICKILFLKKGGSSVSLVLVSQD